MRQLLPLILLLLCSNSFSQNNLKYTPTINDSLTYISQFKQIESRYKVELENLPKENKKYYAEIYKERFDAIKEYFFEKKLYSNNKAHAYLQDLLREIVKNNPQLQQHSIYLFFTSTEIPNAASVGERMLVFNTGLFRKLKNESQVVFVLCHELSHLFLEHGNNQIKKYIETVYSKEFQNELKKIKNTEYQKRTQFEKLTEGLSFNSRRHSRYRESEADSMAIQFMSNTRFDVNESINLLKILDSIDVEDFNTATFLQTTFNSQAYPFKKSWLDKEEGLLGGHAVLDKDKKMDDSLKTHPDCSTRIKKVMALLATIKQTAALKNVINENFEEIQTNMWFDNLENYYRNKRYDIALYNSFKNLSFYKDNIYAVNLIGKTFNSIYDAQKSHRLSNYVNFPSPGNPVPYNDLLQFLQNLHLEEIASINAAFLTKYETQFSTDEAFKKILAESKKKATN